jgi:pimeloyl-ACP methyl ester carboxylesterase
MLATESQLTAPNRTVEAANGVNYAYRRFGDASADALALVLLQHFRGTIDNWDPALVDALAETREVVVFDNTGVGASTGATPRTMTAMAHDAISFIEALGLDEIDLLGYSIGGYIAQELALIRPQLVRRIVLAGTAPEGGIDIHGFSEDVHHVATADVGSADGLLFLFFERSDTSVAKGREFVARIFAREEDRDADVDKASYDAQLDAFTTWGIPDSTRLNRLAGIRQPVLAANGDNDIMVATANTHLLVEHLPDARMEIYPDAGHGFLFQYPEEFSALVTEFLSEA